MLEKLQDFWKAQKKLVVLCLVATFLWGLFAHGYVMTGFSFSHDSLEGMYAAGAENAHKIELGRVLVPAYRYLFRGMFAAPWLTVLLALLWIALSAWCTASVLKIEKPFQIVLMCGLMAVNVTVVALAGTFIHDLDQNMFGMMMGCLAALFWEKRPRGWFVCAAASAAVCLGIYQSYISMTIGLIMIVLIMELLEGKSIASVLRRALEGIAVVLTGTVLFFIITAAIVNGMNIPLAVRDNSLSALGNLDVAAIPSLFLGLYENWWNYFFEMPNSWLFPQAAVALNAVFLLVTVLALLYLVLSSRQLSAAHRVLILLIALLLPLGMNVCYILASGFVHHLMQYAFVMTYLFGMVLLARLYRQEPKKTAFSGIQAVCCGLLALLLWSGVQTANTYHFKKASATVSTNARMTNVYYDMLYEGYVPNRTPLVVDGMLPIARPEGFDAANQIHGGGWHNTITDDPKSIRAYFRFYLGDNANFCSDEEWNAIVEDPVVQNMPAYPDYVYIDYVGDVMVVNLY